MRLRLATTIGLVALTACASGQPDVTTARSQALPPASDSPVATSLPPLVTTAPPEQATTVPVITARPEAPTDPVADLAYSYRIDIASEIDGVAGQFGLAGAHDPSTENGMFEALAIDLLVNNGVDPDTAVVDATSLVTMVNLEGEWYVRGLIPELGYASTIDQTAWYADSIFGDENTDLLGGRQTVDEIVAMLDPLTSLDPTTPQPGESVALTGRLTEADLDGLAPDSIVNFISRQSATDFEFGFDEAGRVSRFEADYLRSDVPGTIEMTISGYGEPLELPRVEAPQPLPDVSTDADTPTPSAPTRTVNPLADSPTLRYSTTLGFQSGTPDISFVVESDGDVLRIDEGDIFAGPRSYTTWNIGVDGYDFVLSSLRTSGLVDAATDEIESAPGGTIIAGGELVFSTRGLDLDRSALTAEQFEVREQFRWQLAQIALTQDRADDVRPWVPSHLTLDIRDEYNPDYYVTADFVWPFEQSIADTVADGPYVCLEGADAALAWNTFLVDGVNNARIPVTDGDRYELTIGISTPDDARAAGPCPAVQDLDSAASGPPAADGSLPAHIVDPLFTTIDGFEREPQDTPPPPRLSACGNGVEITDDEVNMARFDGLMMRRTTVDFEDGDALDLLAGFVTSEQLESGFDLDTVVRNVAEYGPCDAPFADYGITNFSTGSIERVPDGVSAAAFWTFERAGEYVVVADISIRGRIAMVVSSTSTTPQSVADLDRHLDVIASMVPAFDAALTACDATPIDVRGTNCDGLADW